MAQYRTAQGRTVDMASLAAKNEKTRAVGNMRVNARGDTIDGMGRIIEPATAKVTNQYAKTVGSASARQVTTNTQQQQTAPRPQYATPPMPPVQEPVLEEKLATEEDFDDQEDVEIEQIKQQETKKGKK